MSTATATIVNTVTNKAPASEVRKIEQKVCEDAGIGYLPVTGRTFTIKKVLWTLGGKWDKEAKAWMVPAHRHAEAQALANRITAEIEASMAAAKAKREAKAQAAAV
jgi:hypothetical protein